MSEATDIPPPPGLGNARVAAERALRAAQRYLLAIFRNVPGALWLVDRDLRIVCAFGSVDAITASEANALEGRRVQDVVAADAVTEPAVAHHLAALAGQRQAFGYAFRGRWFEITVEPLEDAPRQVSGCIGTAIDVTHGRGIEEALIRERHQLEEAQRVAHIGSFDWDALGDQLSWSDELCRIHGIEPGSFGGHYRDFSAFVHPDDRDAMEATVFGAVRGNQPLDYLHRIVRRDGAIRTLQTRGVVLRDEAGRPTRVVGSCWDITERTEAARALEQMHALLRATLDATDDGILVIDKDGRVPIYNQRFLELWGVPADAMQHVDHERVLQRLLDELDNPAAFLALVRELREHPERGSFDVLHFHDARVFECASRPARIGEAIVGRVWSFRDVTEKERLLRRAELLGDATRLLATLDVESALDGVAHLAVPELGEACAIDVLDGHPRRVLVSQRATQPIPPELNSAALAGQPSTYRAGGACHMAVPLVVKGNLSGVVTLRAAAGRSYAEDDLDLAVELARRIALSLENARLYRDARDALAARDEFLMVVAHEVRGPISSMNLAVEGIQRDTVPKESLPRVLEIIARAAHRLTRFLDGLLDLGKINAGHLMFEFAPVDLAVIVQRVAAAMAAEAAQAGSTLTVTTEGGAIGHWDGARLEQVVTNLLSNAIRFGRGKPIVVAVHVEGPRAVLAVEDRGIGIPPEARDRIFRPFERGVSLRNYGGLGLGLHIVRTIVEALGGTISVESRPGAGATFRVELPRSP